MSQRPAGGRRPGDGATVRTAMTLQEFVRIQSVDEDYERVAREGRHRVTGGDTATGGEPGGARSGSGIGWAGGVMFALFALLIAVAAMQTSRNAVSDERQRIELAAQVQERQQDVADLRQDVRDLQVEIRQMRQEIAINVPEERRITETRDRLALVAGTDPVTGSGVELVIDDAAGATSDREKVLDSDLQLVVNGLWAAGAEAISINGQRLTTFTAIRHAGSAITVNFASLGRPYRVRAIGDPRRLQARFAETTTGQAWFVLQQEVGLRFTMESRDRLRLPGIAVPTLRHIVQKGGAPQ